jgi:hypothetical protein
MISESNNGTNTITCRTWRCNSHIVTLFHRVLADKRHNNKSAIAAKQAAAAAEIDAMRAEYQRILSTEEANSGVYKFACLRVANGSADPMGRDIKTGLIITRAIYGNLKATADEKRDYGLVADVTIPLQCMLQLKGDVSSITIGAHTKSTLSGYDSHSLTLSLSLVLAW